MTRNVQILVLGMILMPLSMAGAAEVPLSEATEECLGCHTSFHPGITADWQMSRHAGTTPAKAMTESELSRRVSATVVPDHLQAVAVGCAECHTLNPESHADTFEHNGYQVHVVVSPRDCATCHPQEVKQYNANLMSHARNNLAGNALYNQLQESILGATEFDSKQLRWQSSDAPTRADACFYCHGTKLEVTGEEIRETDAGEMPFPVIKGWPNQGVGRENLDGSLGACSACHTRHAFSIEMARKPYTCKQCHVGPDVPAYKVYAASKHGNIFEAMQERFEFNTVPWTIGQDFTSPTCATCHISLLVDTDGNVINQRTHQMNDRLPWRIYGLIYAHPHPREPDTTRIRNANGLPLPTSLDGGYAHKYLIDQSTMAKRTQTMQATCRGCHDASWINGHWQKFEHTIQTTNAATKTATQIIQAMWRQGLAKGLEQGASPYDELVERKWTDIWLFYANSIRFASSMAGGGDYGVFAHGRYQLSSRLIELNDELMLRTQLKAAAEPQTP